MIKMGDTTEGILTVAPVPLNPIKCDRYYTTKNGTHFIYGGYEGIPENLLINVCIWLVSKSLITNHVITTTIVHLLLTCVVI